MAFRSRVAGLCRGLFDDASMFPPEAASLPDALATYGGHRVAWYGPMVGSLVCQATRLRSLDHRADQWGIDRVEVSMVVPEGPTAVAAALASARDLPHVEVRAIDVPLTAQPLAGALELLGPLVTNRRAVFLEVGFSTVSESVVHRLALSGVRLKLRAGGTSIDHFRSETDLARVIVLCAAERLAFKCSGGLHHGVRHRDSDTLIDHHGFLNIALAVRVASTTSNINSTQAVLAQADPHAITNQVCALSSTDVDAIRVMLDSVATFNVTDSVTDLVKLGLATER